MSEFKVINVLGGNTIEVSPKWQMELKNTAVSGNRIFIRGLEGLEKNLIAKNRLEKILLNSSEEITLDAPELIDYNSYEDAVVSCSVFLARTNIVYYFPEFVSKH